MSDACLFIDLRAAFHHLKSAAVPTDESLEKDGQNETGLQAQTIWTAAPAS